MKVRIATAWLVLGVAIADPTLADTRATQRRHLDEYTPYLEAPVDEFRFWSLYQWQLVGPRKVVVWSTLKDAYLITVHAPCARLEWARNIGLTSQQLHRVSARFDFVTVGRERCQIEQIRPIDLARMHVDRGAKTSR